MYKERKRFISLLLTMVILLVVISPLQANAAESGTCGGDLTWTLDDAGTLTISGTGAMDDYSSTTSPWAAHKDLIKNVILDEGVTAIGDYAFYSCENLTNITLASTLKTVGAYAFYKCKNLQYVSGTSAIAWVYDYAFYGCEKLPSLPGADLKTVGQWAFAYCAALSQMDLQASMVNNGFGTGAFSGCTSLTEITIPTSVNSIPSSAFFGCTGLETVNAHGQIVTINSGAFNGCTSLTDFSIPGWVTHIYSGAFKNSGLGDITLSANVQYVAPDAFAGCRNMQNINVYSSNSTYKSFSGVLFSNNGTVLYTYPAGRSGEVQIPYTGYAIKQIGQYAFSGCSGITGIEVPNQCTKIGSCAFENCTSLTNVTFTAYSDVTTIGNMAFDGCTSLENIILPGGMQSVGNALFKNCTGLKQVCIPNSMTSIDATAFTDCINLKDVLYGGTEYQWSQLASDNADFADVTIHYNVSYYLNHWTVKSKTPTCTTAGYRKEVCTCGYVRNEENYEPTGVHIFDQEEIADTYWVSDVTCQSPAIYKKSCVCGLASDTETFTVGNAEPDNHNFVDNVCTDCGIIGGQCGTTVYWTLKDDLLTISGTGTMADYAAASDVPWYESRTAINAVVIEEGVTGIGDYAFEGCSFLREITIPASVTGIGSNAFYECSSLTDVYISDIAAWVSISYDNWYSSPLFYHGQAIKLYLKGELITELIIPEGVTIVSPMAFACCSSLRKITIPEGVESIGGWAFSGCIGLCEITIPASVTSIGDAAFESCSNLEDVYYGGTESQWDGLDNTPDVTRIHYDCIAADEHWTEDRTPPTCADNGASFEACSCGYKRNEEVLPATGEHAYESVVTPPTCEVNGYTTYTCTNCGDTYTADEVTSLGHDWGEWEETKAATCTEDGRKTRSCQRCGETETEAIPATGHNMGEGNVCTVCGYSHLVASGTCGDNLTWTLDDAGTLTISGTGAMTDYAAASDVPWYESRTAINAVVIEEGVTGIGSYAFSGCSSLREITIPDGVTEISDSAFSSCAGLISITIPDSVTSIGNSTFSGCSGLNAIDLPDGITAIGDYAFSNCSSLTGIVIPDGVSRIGNYTFYYCTKLTDISIPEGVTAIGYYAFAYCTSLPGIDIPGAVTSVGMSAFESCGSLTSIKFHGNAPAFSYDCFYGVTATAYYPAGNPTWIEDVMHDHSGDLTWVAYHPDNAHNHAAEITAPTCTEQGYTTYTCSCGDSYVDDYVDAPGHDWSEWNQTAAPTCEQAGSKTHFCLSDGCRKTETEAIPATGHDLGEGNVCTVCGQIPLVASGTCGDNLTWTLDANGTLTISGEGPMTDYSGNGAPWNQYASQIKAIVIEEGVTTVGNRAFRNFQNCTSVTLPDTLTDLGMGSFYGMDHLPSITIPSGITAIEDGTFSGCDALTEIHIPEDVTSLGWNSFSYCEGLKTVHIPKSVTTVSSEAFSGCYVLEDVFYASAEADWEKISIGSYNEPLLEANIHCVEATGTCGYNGDNLVWTFYSDGLLKITGSGSMKDYSAGYNSPFYAYKDRINRVDLPDGITTIGKYAFQGGYPNLPYIEIPMSTGYICKNSFGVGYDNVKLKYSGTMEQWKSINHSEYTYDCYYGAECADGTILYMGRCGTNARFDVMGDGTLKITGTGTMSFYQYLQQSSYWDNDDAIKRVEIAEGITNIAAYAFKNCANLKSIVIPASVKTISYDVFYNCNALTDVYYGSNERAWDSMNISDEDNDPLFSATIHYTDLCEDGHDLQSHEAQTPGCETIGWEAYEACSRCYYTTYVELPATGHDHKTVVTAPTCEEDGYTTYTCHCGDTYTGDETPAEGHAYESAVTPPTCEESGYTTYTCRTCGDTYTGDETAAEGHEYTAVVTEPTCTAGGFTTNTCHCGETYISDEVAALGHSFGSWVVSKEPSASEEGLETRTCTGCGLAEERAVAKWSNPFTDVPEGSFYYEPVLWAVENGITNGATETTFNPEGTCLRAQVVTFLWRAAGCPEPASANNPFTDVKESDFFYKPVLWAVENGITNGTDATTFGAYDNCNRAAVVTFLWRAAGSPEPASTDNPFADVKEGDFFYKAVLWAVENGITNGVDATHFGPTQSCNRAQVVTFLFRAKN